jgi:prolyl 4-hydroxylase
VQENVTKDWPLTIKDVQGKRHQVVMQPGDMLLYEGAKCQHGRPMALQGNVYADVFIHFTPSSGWGFI